MLLLGSTIDEGDWIYGRSVPEARWRVACPPKFLPPTITKYGMVEGLEDQESQGFVGRPRANRCRYTRSIVCSFTAKTYPVLAKRFVYERLRRQTIVTVLCA